MVKTEQPGKKSDEVNNVREVPKRDRTAASEPRHARELVKAPAKVKEKLSTVLSWYKKNATDTVTIKCNNCGNVIAIEARMKDRYEKSHIAGYVVVPLNDLLMSYRKRTNGTMGYSCACGNSDILLPEEQELRGAFSVAPHVEDRIKKRIQSNDRKRKHGELEVEGDRFTKERVK